MSQKYRPSLSQTIAAQAPLDLGDQVDLEDLINHSKRSEAERERFEKLAASQSQKAKHADLAKAGQLGANATVGYVEQISAYAAKQRDKSRRKNAKPDTGPTPERMAKLMERSDAREISPPISDAETRALTKAHAISAPLDKYGPHMGARLENAGRRLLNIYLLAAAGPRVTSSYEGMSGNVPGPRTGGVADHVRLAASMVSVIEKEWPVEYIQAVEWFLTQTTIKQDGSAMRFEDIGRSIMPFWKSTEAHKGGGYVRFVDMLIHAERWFDRQDALGWRGPPPTDTEQEQFVRLTAEAARRVHEEMRSRGAVHRELAEAKRRREEKRQLSKGGR